MLFLRQSLCKRVIQKAKNVLLIHWNNVISSLYKIMHSFNKNQQKQYASATPVIYTILLILKFQLICGFLWCCLCVLLLWSINSNSSHDRWLAGSFDIILKVDFLEMTEARFVQIIGSGFRREDFSKFANRQMLNGERQTLDKWHLWGMAIDDKSSPDSSFHC